MQELQDDTLPKPKEDDFSPWLSSVTTAYTSLSNDKRNILLKHLIANSEPYQLNFLSTFIPALSCRDFISHLPIELVTIILKHINGKRILLFREVSKSWKDRIDSLTDLWQIKAFEAGVDIQAISAKYPVFADRARVYKANYCLAELFLSSLKQKKMTFEAIPNIRLDRNIRENDFCLSEDSIAVADCGTGIFDIFSVPEWSLKCSVTIRQPIKYILLFKNPYLFACDYGGTMVCCNIDYFMNCDEDSNEDDDSEINADGISRRHTFIGHTSPVWTADVMETMGRTYVITGSKDKTVKIWIIHRTRVSSELFMTLENAHTLNVSGVHFLPCGENGELRFISWDKKDIFVWSLDVQTRNVRSDHVSATYEIASLYFDVSKPEDVFTTEWDSCDMQSLLTSYKLSHKNEIGLFGIELVQEWSVSVYGFKATILGVGTRFALLMCSISPQDFLLFDLISGRCMVTFTTLTRLPVKLYDSSWLNGFTFDKKVDKMPTLIGHELFNLGMLYIKFPVFKDGADVMESYFQ